MREPNTAPTPSVRVAQTPLARQRESAAADLRHAARLISMCRYSLSRRRLCRRRRSAETISLVQTPFRHFFIRVVSDARRNFPASYLFASRLTGRKIGISQRQAVKLIYAIASHFSGAIY